MRRHPRLALSAALLLALVPLLSISCSEAKAGTPACCAEAGKLIGQMDDCCVENLGKPTADMTGCCTEGMKLDATDRPDCCTKTLALRSQMSDCCASGMKSATDVCCESDDAGH